MKTLLQGAGAKATLSESSKIKKKKKNVVGVTSCPRSAR